MADIRDLTTALGSTTHAWAGQVRNHLFAQAKTAEEDRDTTIHGKQHAEALRRLAYFTHALPAGDPAYVMAIRVWLATGRGPNGPYEPSPKAALHLSSIQPQHDPR